MHRRFIAAVVIGLVVTSGAILIAGSAQAGANNEDVCVKETVFDRFDKSSMTAAEKGIPGLHLDGAGNIAYLYDDFSNYNASQRLIDGFEDVNAWSVGTGAFDLTGDRYEGSGALSYKVPSGAGRELVLQKTLEKPTDMRRWSNSGYITMWIKVTDPDGIDSAAIELEDDLGSRRVYAPLENVHSSTPNTFKNDPDYPDLIYPLGDPKKEAWTDFTLGPGWNYLLWRADMYDDDGREVEMSRIKSIYLRMQTNEGLVGETLVFDDLRIQDGLQKSSNPTNGMWYPPHGRPQYGVYDIDRIDQQDGAPKYELHLLNVRNTQYPSNGDHARMISSAPVPIDFVMRVKFTLDQVGHRDETLMIPSPFPAWTPREIREISLSDGMRDNAYFRVTYDFEPSWDPGHEWFGAYLSLQYDRLGILTVWPLERNTLQDQEPKAGARTATTEFAPEAGVPYEMHILAKGQFSSVTIYEVKDDGCLDRKSGMSYIFSHARHGPEKRYPVAIESTGNMRTIIHEVEVTSLKPLSPDAPIRHQ